MDVPAPCAAGAVRPGWHPVSTEVDAAMPRATAIPGIIWKIKAVWRLAEYSRDCLKTLRAATGIEYEGRRGTLQLFRTAQQYE